MNVLSLEDVTGEGCQRQAESCNAHVARPLLGLANPWQHTQQAVWCTGVAGAVGHWRVLQWRGS
jgi:hypothetical protein